MNNPKLQTLAYLYIRPHSIVYDTPQLSPDPTDMH